MDVSSRTHTGRSEPAKHHTYLKLMTDGLSGQAIYRDEPQYVARIRSCHSSATSREKRNPSVQSAEYF
jgi:hypothetical protein